MRHHSQYRKVIQILWETYPNWSFPLSQDDLPIWKWHTFLYLQSRLYLKGTGAVSGGIFPGYIKFIT